MEHVYTNTYIIYYSMKLSIWFAALVFTYIWIYADEKNSFTALVGPIMLIIRLKWREFRFRSYTAQTQSYLTNA